jgi:hypothetical protein
MAIDLIGKYIETVGSYQLHLFALQSPDLAGRWVPYLMIHRFDETAGDFKCVLEKHRVSDNNGYESEAQAIEAARRAGSAWISSRHAS